MSFRCLLQCLLQPVISLFKKQACTEKSLNEFKGTFHLSELASHTIAIPYHTIHPHVPYHTTPYHSPTCTIPYHTIVSKRNQLFSNVFAEKPSPSCILGFGWSGWTVFIKSEIVMHYHEKGQAVQFWQMESALNLRLGGETDTVHVIGLKDLVFSWREVWCRKNSHSWNYRIGWHIQKKIVNWWGDISTNILW